MINILCVYALRIDIDKELEKVDVEETAAKNTDVGPSTFKPERIAHQIDTEGRLGVQIRNTTVQFCFTACIQLLLRFLFHHVLCNSAAWQPKAA